MDQPPQKPARTWAAEIAALKTLPERRARLAPVPTPLRELVETHLKIQWEQRQHQRLVQQQKEHL